MDLTEAQAIAKKFITEFEPFCHRIEAAGSVRRNKLSQIKDIEIVMVPRTAMAVGLRDQLKKHRGKYPSKNTSFHYGGGKIDLFITEPEKWGCIFLIRTGSLEFNKGLMTFALAKHMKFREGRLWRGHEVFFTPRETDVFEALGIPYIEPEDRIGSQAIAKAVAGKV